MKLMYPNYYNTQQPTECQYKVISQAVANDSSFTYANLLYSTQSVAIACVIFAANVF
jgi:hypothetical protein